MASKRTGRPGRDGRSWTCRKCGKRAYTSWSHAAWDAREQRDKYRERRREWPYFSRECGGAIHVGSRQGSVKR